MYVNVYEYVVSVSSSAMLGMSLYVCTYACECCVYVLDIASGLTQASSLREGRMRKRRL